MSQLTNSEETIPLIESILGDTNFTRLTERLSELELSLENADWVRLGYTSDNEFSIEGIKKAAKLARMMFLKNPLIGRGVRLASFYVFGRGVSITAKDEDVNTVVQKFLDDQQNQRELTSALARKQKDIDLRLDGNLFLALFVHPVTGNVRIADISLNEIEDIITNPDNKSENWYYKRVWVQTQFDANEGTQKQQTVTRYYRDYSYNPDDRPTKIGAIDVSQDAVIYSVKVGSFSDWKFGLTEVFSGLDWAKAYSRFLSDFATVIRVLAMFAWEMRTKGGSGAVQAAKARLGTTFATNGVGADTNPPPITGSTYISDKVNGSDLTPMKTAGSTTTADEGIALRHMVAASVGLPDPMLSGDARQGTLATAKSLDRPTELGFLDRQELWRSVFTDLINYQILQSVLAPKGALRMYASVITNEYGDQTVVFNGDTVGDIDITFPAILERDTKELVDAIVNAGNLIPDKQLLAKLLLTALDVDDIDEKLETMFEDNDIANQLESLRESLNDYISQTKTTKVV